MLLGLASCGPAGSRRRLLRTLAAGSLLVAASSRSAAEPTPQAKVGRTTGLPIPRFVSLASDRANLRVGPRRFYDVRAVYRRRGLPLLVLDEFDTWRQVQDHEGDVGWIHTGLLSGRVTVLVTDGPRPMRRRPMPNGPVLSMLEPGVIADVVRCDAEWCFVEVERRRGWLAREGLWGVLP